MTNRQLLKGWRKARLREVLDTLESGLRPSGGVGGLHEGVPSIGGEHLNNEGGFDLSELRYVPHDFYAKMQRGRIQVRDIVIVKDGATTGKVSLVPADWPFDKSAVNEHVFILRPTKEALPEYLFFYLYSHEGQHEIKKSFQGSAQGGINQTFAEHVTVPLPPLPVQERIVQILQKADEIRRKRREALELADTILPSIYHEMFGDLTSNPKGYERMTLGQVTTLVTSGYTPRGGANNYVPEGPLLLRSQNIQMLRLALEDCAHLPESIFEEMQRVHVQQGDVLLNITGKGTAGRIAWVEDLDLRAAVNQHVCIIRPNPNRVSAQYLAFTLATPTYQYIIENAPGSAQSGFNHARVRALEILVPPLPVQKAFVMQVQALMETRNKCLIAMDGVEKGFEGVLARAFTGELTAEWEATNAEEIAAQQALHERLPRLLVLALLVEKVKRPNRAVAEVLVTALMKYAFLLQMEGNGGRRRLYHFVPYHYGPFAKDLYTDLQTLQEEGLVRVENDSEEDKTKITLVDSTKANEALAALPDDLKEDAAAIIETYGSLDHHALLRTVYEKYPAYAKKSRLRRARGAGRAQKPQGRRG